MCEKRLKEKQLGISSKKHEVTYSGLLLTLPDCTEEYLQMCSTRRSAIVGGICSQAAFISRFFLFCCSASFASEVGLLLVLIVFFSTLSLSWPNLCYVLGISP